MSEVSRFSLIGLLGVADTAVRGILELRNVALQHGVTMGTALERASLLQNNLLSKSSSLKKAGMCLGNDLSQIGGKPAESIVKAQNMFDAFESVPVFKDYSEQTRPAEMAAIRAELSVIGGSIETGQDFQDLMARAESIQFRMQNLATSVQKDLCRVERQAVLQVVGESLGNLHYQVELRDNALRGVKGRTCFWAKADEMGRLELDASGFSGLSCQKEIKRVEQEFRRNGLILKRTSKNTHGKPEGGVLAQELDQFFNPFSSIHGKNHQTRNARQALKQEVGS